MKRVCAKGRIESFNAWLNGELAKRGWSDYQLAREADLSPAVISRARAGTLPKWEGCFKLAQALDYPAELVFREAGLLPANSEDPQRAQLTTLYDQADEAKRQQMVDFARFIVTR